MVELEAGDALSGRRDGRFGELAQLTAIDKGLQDVLLNIEIIVVDGRKRVAERGEVLHRLLDAVVIDVVAGSFGAQHQVIADVLLDEAVAVVAADHRIGQVHVLDFGLQLAAMMPGDLAPEDHGDLVGLPDRSIGIEQAFAELVEGGAAPEDEVVAEFDLREEQPMLAAGMFAFAGGKEWGEAREPFLAAGQKVPRSERLGERLQAFGCRAGQEGIAALPERDAFLAHVAGEPVVLIKTDARRERKVGTDPHEQASPLPVVDVEVVLDDPAVRDRKMPFGCSCRHRSPS